ncbi:methionyl-tRNA formyltransferase [Alphaproteobacteria bacterium]|nr:methionyl-tRNA formyltransferase [Alphaproteobacteria bacterium]
MKKKYRLVFFGSPDFALPPLKTLYLGGYEIVGVYTQEPKKKSRGLKELKTPVHIWAESQLLPVYAPAKLNNQSLEEFVSLKPDAAILFAYGKIIPLEWLNTPVFGFINIHASLLPRWRGAAPVQRAIENNDKSSGITIMKMNEGLDEGPIIASQEIALNSETNGQTLIEQISYDSCSLLYKNLEKYLKGMLSPTEQDHDKSTYAYKINKNESRLNWNFNAENLEQKIRAFYPYPATWFLHQGKRYKVLKAKVTSMQGTPGEILQSPLIIGCQKNSLEILEIQAEGKKAQSIDQFLLGNSQFKINSLITND